MTILRVATPPDRSAHPDAPANRRLGSREFYGVRETYSIEQTSLRLDSRLQSVDVVVGSGDHAHWYAPFVQTEIPGELASLRTADDQGVLDFAATYGEMGFDQLLEDPDEIERRVKAHQVFTGDPVPWLRAHATGVYICLAVTHALESDSRKRTELPPLLDRIEEAVYGSGAETLYLRPLLRHGSTLEARARLVRAAIVNANLIGIHRYVHCDRDADRSFFRWRAPVNVVYWHLANAIDGGTVKRCGAEGCEGVFIQTDPRQRYCPKTWRQSESGCATRQRQRKKRGG